MFFLMFGDLDSPPADSRHQRLQLVDLIATAQYISETPSDISLDSLPLI